MRKEVDSVRIFRKVGKTTGKAGGFVVGGGVKLVGKAVGTKMKETGEYIESVGKTVGDASENALDSAGQFIDGATQGSYGLIKKDKYYKQKGLEDLKDSSVRTAKGIGQAVVYTGKSAGTTYRGFRESDIAQVVEGLKGIGKVAAVSTLAIGVIDVVDGADGVQAETMATINDELIDHDHPVTGVPFVEKTVELPNGDVIEGTFPVFESEFKVVISEDVYLASDDTHFDIANESLYHSIQENPSLAHTLGFTQAEVDGLQDGETPEAYTWHHNEEQGVIQLVDEETHANTAHTGGRSIWGGGTEYR
ncbi:HNH endonuclease [Aquibacillus sediminis]|uniref:HNH endonuclease n=1 Tax=Aquibacillus sediminis TaxID=2574734 RepID=UPI0011086B1C|nr:HNH endonuclease [Aquibacillus sediminis]